MGYIFTFANYLKNLNYLIAFSLPSLNASKFGPFFIIKRLPSFSYLIIPANAADAKNEEKYEPILTPLPSLLKYAAMNGKNGQNINQLPDSSLLKMINIYMTPEEKQKIKDAPIENYIETFFGDIPSLKMGVSKLIDKLKLISLF